MVPAGLVGVLGRGKFRSSEELQSIRPAGPTLGPQPWCEEGIEYLLLCVGRDARTTVFMWLSDILRDTDLPGDRRGEPSRQEPGQQADGHPPLGH